MNRILVLFLLAIISLPRPVQAGAKVTLTPYTEQNVVFDFFLDEPDKISSALFWIRSLMNPLQDAPYNQAPELMDLVVVIHGSEIVTTVKHNYEKYHDSVERMKYYASLGVQFKVCSLAAADYGYNADDFQDFIELVPSAITELAHWQLQGYALIIPQVMERTHSIDEIR